MFLHYTDIVIFMLGYFILSHPVHTLLLNRQQRSFNYCQLVDNNTNFSSSESSTRDRVTEPLS